MGTPKEPSLDRLLQELNSFREMKSDRLTILGLQLYAEHYVNEIVMEQIGNHAKREVREHLTFPQKLRILESMGIIDDKKKGILEKLNKVRNLFIHELVINKNDINKSIESVDFRFRDAWVVSTESGKVVKSQDIDLGDYYPEKIKDKFTQLVISSIILISGLHGSLMNLRGEHCQELIEMTSKKNNYGVWEIFLIANKFIPPEGDNQTG